MSDTVHAHEFRPNHKGVCKMPLGGKLGYCLQREDAPAHQRWIDQRPEREAEELTDAKLLASTVADKETGIQSNYEEVDDPDTPSEWVEVFDRVMLEQGYHRNEEGEWETYD